MNDIRGAVRAGADLLKRAGITSYILDARLILAHTLDKNTEWLLSRPEYFVDSDIRDSYMRSITERAAGRPVQYITGKCEFYSIPFYADERALIPRPDTELLAGLVIEAVGDTAMHIVDMGTGSGCIAVAVCMHCKNARVTAADISLDALSLAEKNAALHGVSDMIAFVSSDLFNGIDYTYKADVIVSNPPYINTGDINLLSDSVRLYEPKTALDGGDDGLHFYRRIAKESCGLLKENGRLFLETGCEQAKDVINILSGYPYGGFDIKRDLSGRDRVVCCTKGHM